MISVYIYHSQVLKEQSKSSKLKGDLMNMEAVLEWESYFGQVNWSPQYHHYIIRKYLFSTLIFQANYYKNQQNYEAAHREASVEEDKNSLILLCLKDRDGFTGLSKRRGGQSP